MTARSIKVGLGIVTTLVASSFFLPTAAHADYAPTTGDVVGVGSDTLQQLVDFVADGDYTGGSGYNSAGNKNKFISIDATADANSRLAYGANGVGSNSCAPGTGKTAGTGNTNSNHADKPCLLNPTVTLRAGSSPVQRPNGSSAGYNLLVQDTDGDGNGKGYIDFSRASSPRGSNAQFDSVTVGKDPLQILSSSTTNAPSGLSAAQLKSIYQCSTTDFAQVGGSAGTIVPLLPQLGSGTRSSFLSALGLTEGQVGTSCVQNVEENDPEAIDATGNPANAIEPMSVGRLFLFQGKKSDGTSTGQGGYFNDPSCPFPVSESTTPSGCTTNAALNPNVKLLTGAPSDTTSVFNVNRSLYIYFRHADINSTLPFQPGSDLNWVRTMLYNPCSGAGHTSGCTTVGGTTYGPGGAPYFAGAASTISKSGIQPTALTYTPSGP